MGSNRKLPYLFIPSKTAKLVTEFAVDDLLSGRTTALVPEFAVKDLPLGRSLLIIIIMDRLSGIVVSTSDYHPRGPGFDSRLYTGNFSRSIGSGTGSTQPREDNWVAT